MDNSNKIAPKFTVNLGSLFILVFLWYILLRGTPDMLDHINSILQSLATKIAAK